GSTSVSRSACPGRRCPGAVAHSSRTRSATWSTSSARYRNRRRPTPLRRLHRGHEPFPLRGTLAEPARHQEHVVHGPGSNSGPQLAPVNVRHLLKCCLAGCGTRRLVTRPADPPAVDQVPHCPIVRPGDWIDERVLLAGIPQPVESFGQPL